jgi:glycosyltransferase involved in cell wall biosynthesis
VEVISDESWLGKPFPDLSFIDESYLGVVFFQLLPSEDILKIIKNNNIIYFPMYDQNGRLGFNFWNKYYGLKVINFSSTLHRKLVKWGLDSMHIQYFPKPQEFMPGNNNAVFFWQRLTEINIDIISKLFGSDNIRIHIHRAIDPNHRFQQPSAEQERKFQITYSDWFETREDMIDIIRHKGIYIAPREFEGIGLSFLEAMSMGKSVVAVDNPTMNEYIQPGETGYLFDLNNPKEIDFSNIEQVQKNTYDYMKNGYEYWEREKHNIIDFIEK